MSYLKIGILVMFLYNISSCTSDDNQIVGDAACLSPELPGDYFPAFPKSWWSYYNMNNELVEFNISTNYEICEEKCRPIFSNLNKCIQGSSFIHRFYAGLGTSATVESPIYSTAIDSVLVCPVSFSTFKEETAFIHLKEVPYRRITTKLDTSLTVNGTTYNNVLVMFEYNKFDSLHRYYDYFAKDIGLVKRDSVSHSDSTQLIEILRLDTYHIEN